MTSRALRHALALLLLVALAAPAALAAQTPPPRDDWPTNGWPISAPALQGMDPTLLAAADQRVREQLPLLSALLVVRGGDFVYERYYNGHPPEAPIHVWSVTKSVTDLAAGIAVAEGLLRIDQTLGELIPDRIPAEADPRVANITVEQLLTMTSGFAWDSRTDFLHLDDAPDWAARTLTLPMACDPGTCYEYNSGNAHLVSVVLQQVAGQTEADYLQPRLFDPLGIARPTWRQSPQGETAGAFGLELTARDAAKIGYLALNRGFWDGAQLVPAEWIDASTTQQSSGTSDFSGANLGLSGYGYFWWVRDVVGVPSYFALGYGSQVVYVVPALDLVAVALVAAPNMEAQQNPVPLIEELIVPAVRPEAATAAESSLAFAPPAAQQVVAATPVAGGARIFALPGDAVFPEGIAYQPATGDFYVGSSIDGTLYRGNVGSGEVGVVAPGQTGLVALGLALDDRGRLFVAGGQTGAVAVYDVASGALLTQLDNGLAPNTYLNGVAVAANGDAYVTDSFNPILYRLPAAAIPAAAEGATPAATPVPVGGALEVFLDLTATAFAFGPGFNANGIVVTPDDRFLLVVQSNTGALYRIDLETRELTPVDLGGASLLGGDGMDLDGQTLYVVAGDAVTVVDLAADYASGQVVASFTDPTFSTPSSVAHYDGCLLVVNSQFANLQGQPTLPFTVSGVPIPGAGGGTPVADGAALATPVTAGC